MAATMRLSRCRAHRLEEMAIYTGRLDIADLLNVREVDPGSAS
jgi:hypothetical protein